MYNYLEVQKASQIINQQLPAQVCSWGFYEFKKYQAPDLNLGIECTQNQKKFLIVIALKAPLVAIFLSPLHLWQKTKQTWNGCFKQSDQWLHASVGSTLVSCQALTNERQVVLTFDDNSHLTFDLFSNHPNWRWQKLDQQIAWREAKTSTHSNSLRNLTPPQFSLRDFSHLKPLYSFNEMPDLWMAQILNAWLTKKTTEQIQSSYANLNQILQTQLIKQAKLKTELNREFQQAQNYDHYRVQGELLKSALAQYPKESYFDQIMVDQNLVSLNKNLTLIENSALNFKKYKKYKNALQEITLRLNAVSGLLERTQKQHRELVQFYNQRNELDLAEQFKTLKQWHDQLVGQTQPNQPTSKVAKKWNQSGAKRFFSSEKLAIWVGKNHKENQEIVIRLAKGNDLWFHLKGVPGAHAIVQIPNKKTASLETLLDAATLVAFYSGVKEKQKVEVDYTFRKYVKRVAGQSAEKFLVNYSQNKTLVIQLDQNRLKKLFQTQETS